MDMPKMPEDSHPSHFRTTHYNILTFGRQIHTHSDTAELAIGVFPTLPLFFLRTRTDHRISY